MKDKITSKLYILSYNPIKLTILIGKFRGFGFVTFEEQTTVDKVISTKQHIIFNKKVDIKKAESKNKTKATVQDEKSRKLYVSDIPQNFTKCNF
jgi:RNA recognition motif-containing protein